ncbi:hypothetical protein BH23PLA1_BH23PLA1_12330 [soil metagenome]
MTSDTQPPQDLPEPKPESRPGTDPDPYAAPALPAAERLAPEAPRSPNEPAASGFVWLCALAAGLLAALISFGIIEATHELVKYDEKALFAQQSSLEDQAEEYRRQDLWISQARSMFFHGALGAALGLLLSLAGGLARRTPQWPRLITIAGLGLVVGGVIGVVASMLIVPLHLAAIDSANNQNNDDMISPLLAQGAIWALLGIVGGVFFGLALGGSRRQVFRALEGGLLGAVVAAFVYEFGGGVLLTSSETHLPIASQWTGRMMAAFVLPMFVALGIALAAPQRKPKPEATSPLPGPSGSETRA